MSRREVKESPVGQGSNEQIAYILTTTPWGGSPSSESCSLYDMTKEPFLDVSATHLSGDASSSGDTVTSPLVLNLEPGHLYRLNIQFTSNANVREAFLMIEGEL